MGSNCSSLGKNGKKDKVVNDKDKEDEDRDHDRQNDNKRKGSADSIPYGREQSTASELQSVPEKTAEEASSTEYLQPEIKIAIINDSNAVNTHTSNVAFPDALSPPPPARSPDTLSAASSRPESASGNTSPESYANRCYTQLFSIKDDNRHLIAISLHSNELIVWDIYEEKVVRTLQGISQPRDVKMVDKYRAIVLCDRELKLYNLNSGTFEVKLKGVMNQKMPFYGIHEDKYVVALSRNRMYVNMINTTTGDLETTFKVGEDRFLNSLLVSANGKICVCGDETQKPFPLLVWDLTNRKLLYDLRIPHHEFITKLAAISNDGHYVVSVCKELNTTSPNSIIVYDLQSGTLFKKWKPECNSVSLAISTQTGCVLNGIESGEVLVWDLTTGTKKHSLTGHTSAPDVLQATEKVNYFLSYDSSGTDPNIRIWELDSGSCLMVYTPESQISCCRLSPDGNALVFGVLASMALKTVLLNNKNKSSDESNDSSLAQYGDEVYDGMIFDLKP
ncbi:uncharacterized WD repeat-containing protein alr2800-like [Oppia nitens]|uniref:uncharacterized WD repeat-containing protein alr2800-like n=1 Tax=Oppia nitens TaxID=1686743 RepID=UPI0023DA0929|nr:uncharacterized WD repeat-containing protein alr2800-like [Oppia nitens]XP_054164760.1 uncharacterized WD repeat-containing protein alr2800-like [Oppia nitens]